MIFYNYYGNEFGFCVYPQPPIFTIGLGFWTTIPSCLNFFLCTCACTRCAISSSVYPSRMGLSKLVSSDPNKHTLKLPSAISLNLLHEPQKCSVMEVTKDTSPLKPSTLKSFATAFLSQAVLWRTPKWSSILFLVTLYGSILSKDHTFPWNGIHSMKRTLRGLSFVSSTKSSTSSSFTPFITTKFTLSFSMDCSSALSITPNTLLRPFDGLLVICSNLSGLKVSRDRFRCVSPACVSWGNMRCKIIPFDVIATCSSPCISLSDRTISTTSFLSVGSPPVSRIFFTPACTNSLAALSSSSVDMR
mmetsp:Transcript_2787/g.4645  ORF Transcript_2787/g.4645 Transcript_2787/m.4645 type:complete len:303 (-) Transcript_2787:755-1663(-)